MFLKLKRRGTITQSSNNPLVGLLVDGTNPSNSLTLHAIIDRIKEVTIIEEDMVVEDLERTEENLPAIIGAEIMEEAEITTQSDLDTIIKVGTINQQHKHKHPQATGRMQQLKEAAIGVTNNRAAVGIINRAVAGEILLLLGKLKLRKLIE